MKRLSGNVDYLKLHEYLMHIGSLGEAYVFDKEREKLKETEYLEMVDNSPLKDHNNGYDILSYEKDGTELYIEVKSETGVDNDFYITANERRVGERFIREGKKYLIYRVHSVLDKDKIYHEVIENLFNNPEYQFEEHLWKVSKKAVSDK